MSRLSNANDNDSSQVSQRCGPFNEAKADSVLTYDALNLELCALPEGLESLEGGLLLERLHLLWTESELLGILQLLEHVLEMQTGSDEGDRVREGVDARLRGGGSYGQTGREESRRSRKTTDLCAVQPANNPSKDGCVGGEILPA